MDDIHLYEGYDEREDCISPVFSACSSSSSVMKHLMQFQTLFVHTLHCLYPNLLDLLFTVDYRRNNRRKSRCRITVSSSQRNSSTTESDLFSSARKRRPQKRNCRSKLTHKHKKYLLRSDYCLSYAVLCFFSGKRKSRK